MILTTKDGGQDKSNCDGSGVPPSSCNVKYVYDSSLIIVIVEDSLITTINNQTRQVVYSSIEKDYVTILDILSGNFNNIEFLNKTGTYLDHFIVLLI